MNNTSHLGRGLSGLISEASTSFAQVKIPRESFVLPIKNITFNPNQPRKIIHEQEIEDLANSIKTYGIIQPIIVRQIGDKMYQIIAGERRYHAAKIAGLVEVPVVIKQNIGELEAVEIAIVENIQRAELEALDEAAAYNLLVMEYGYTQESLSQKFGKSRTYITNMMRLLKLPDTVKKMILDKKISASHARTIVNTEDPKQIAEMIIKNNLSVRETESLVKKILGGEKLSDLYKNDKDDKFRDESISELEVALKSIIGNNVKLLSVKDGKYKVTISCKNISELNDFIERVGSK